jgi:hypothetical protein
MLKTWQTQMSPVVSRHMSVESFVEDIASSFLHILSPLSLRPVSILLICSINLSLPTEMGIAWLTYVYSDLNYHK